MTSPPSLSAHQLAVFLPRIRAREVRGEIGRVGDDQFVLVLDPGAGGQLDFTTDHGQALALLGAGIARRPPTTRSIALAVRRLILDAPTDSVHARVSSICKVIEQLRASYPDVYFDDEAVPEAVRALDIEEALS